LTDPDPQHLQAGLRISQISLSWTVAAGGAAIAIGVVGNSLSLITFGLIGLLDGIGSASLIVHFGHAQRHQTISARYEQVAFVIITVGMATIGVATAADSAYRLAVHSESSPLILGTTLAAGSIIVLATLAIAKYRIAGRIPSHALRSDGWVSGVGSVLALVVLIGSIFDRDSGLWWLDPAAAMLIACGAVVLSAVLARRSSGSTT
jgi:divalent metal cation (Fe/Co/Zn/Cd) transporter